jgi:phosphonate transport system substrate-binding protein
VVHDAKASERALVFAVASSVPTAEQHLEVVCAELGRALGCVVSAKVLPSYAALAEEVAGGGADIAWAPPLVAIQLERAKVVSLALCCSRGGQIGYHAALFTRHASTMETLADLKGCHVAWVDPQSSAGYLVPRMRLASAGLDPATLFGRESFLGTHERVACAVLEGEADAGATYLSLDPKTGRGVSAGWLEAGAGMNGAFILATVGPIPADVIVVASRLSAELKAAITASLAAIPERLPEAVGGLFRADGFAAPLGAHFEELRALSAVGVGAR